MKTSEIKREENKIEFEVSIENEEFENLYNKALGKLARGIKVPGFRPGKAPISLIRGLIDEERVLDEIKEDVSKKAIQEILKDEKKVFPTLETSIKDFSRDNPKFTITIYKIPEVKSPEIEKVIEKIKDVSSEEIDKKIEELREEFKEYIPKKDGEVDEGDYVVLSYGLEEEEKRETSSLVVGEGRNIFEGHVVGMKVGEEKTVKINEAKFKIKVLEIKYPKLPELNEDFFKDFDAKDIDSFKNKVRELIIKERLSEDKIENFIADEILKENNFFIPKEYIEEEAERKFEELKRELLRSGIKLSDFLKIRGQTEEDVKESLRKSAESEIKYNLILDFLSEKETVSDEEVKEYYGDKWQEAFNDEKKKENAKIYLKKRKYLNRLIEEIRKKIESQLKETEEEKENKE
mgnify:CR=1 FL=1